MTQIITTITREYVLLASDRRLTFLTGPKHGHLADDDTCKLVSLCNTCGIGYTGLAQIEGSPTHEWIAKALASEQCSDPANASRILSERAKAALLRVPRNLRRQEFVIAGWAHFTNLTGLRSHVCAITNMTDATGRMLFTEPAESFAVLLHALHDEEDLWTYVIGQPLQLERTKRLERNLQNLVKREMSPKAALRLLVDEVIHTSGQRHTVGKKVLGLCIPKRAVQSSTETGRSVMIAAQPDEDAASFCYYDPTYSELQQFGPTVTCAGRAETDITTENNPLTGYQSSSFRILAMPKENRSPPPNTAIFKRPQTPRPVIGFEFGISVDNAVVPGSVYAIPAAIKNTGDAPIAFAQNLSDSVGQEVPPSMQGGAVPAITLGWPTGAWSIKLFAPVSREKFAGLTLAPGEIFKFNFGSFTVPKAPMGSTSSSSIVDLSIRFTDTITGQFSAVRNLEFDFPTKVGPTLRFRIDTKSASSGLSFRAARVIDTVTGELISGPIDGSPPGTLSGPITDTSICTGKPGVGLGLGQRT
jgi:hypothetical protein